MDYKVYKEFVVVGINFARYSVDLHAEKLHLATQDVHTDTGGR